MEALHSYEITDDKVIDPEFIEDKIVDIRNTLIADEASRGLLDNSYYQMMETLPVTIHNNKIELDGKVTVLHPTNVGVVTIPSLYTRIGHKAIQYLGLPDLSLNFDYKEMTGFLSNRYAKYTSGRPIYTIVSTKVLVRNYGLTGDRFVSAIAIVEDPRKVPGFDYRTSPFPVADPQKLELLVIKHIQATATYGPDKINDANVNINPQAK